MQACLCKQIDIDELWVVFGTSKTFRYIPAHEIACSLGNRMASALPVFHAFTGCDTVSAFVCRAKNVWAVWRVASYSLRKRNLSSNCPGVQGQSVRTPLLCWRDLVYLCMADINVVRNELLTRKGRFRHENLPPTKAALVMLKGQLIKGWRPCMGPGNVLKYDAP